MQLDAVRTAEITQRSMVDELNKMGVSAPRGGK